MGRREIREHIFCMLFRKEFYQTQTELSEQVDLYLDTLNADRLEEEIAPLSEEDRSYMEAKVAAIFELVPELDEKINAVAKGWKTGRMGKVDLSIIRLALYEMAYDEAVPEKVAINEAVELARKFGQNESPSFVNGILAKLVAEKA